MTQLNMENIMDRKNKIHNTYTGILLINKYNSPILYNKTSEVKHRNIIKNILNDYIGKDVTLVVTINGKDLYNWSGILKLCKWQDGKEKFTIDCKVGTRYGFCKILEDYIGQEIEISIVENDKLGDLHYINPNYDNRNYGKVGNNINYKIEGKVKTFKEVDLDNINYNVDGDKET